MTSISAFEFVFVASALLAVVLTVRSVYLVVRGRWRRAAATLGVLGALVVAYAATLVLTSLVSSPRYVPLGTEFCFDDWCFVVEKCEAVRSLGEGTGAVKAGGEFRLVTVR